MLEAGKGQEKKSKHVHKGALNCGLSSMCGLGVKHPSHWQGCKNRGRWALCFLPAACALGCSCEFSFHPTGHTPNLEARGHRERQ